MSADEVETTNDDAQTEVHAPDAQAEASTSDESHGATHELPPEPATRSITPATADFENPPPLPTLIWPAFWMAVGVVLIALCLKFGWHEGLGH